MKYRSNLARIGIGLNAIMHTIHPGVLCTRSNEQGAELQRVPTRCTSTAYSVDAGAFCFASAFVTELEICPKKRTDR